MAGATLVAAGNGAPDLVMTALAPTTLESLHIVICDTLCWELSESRKLEPASCGFNVCCDAQASFLSRVVPSFMCAQNKQQKADFGQSLIRLTWR